MRTKKFSFIEAPIYQGQKHFGVSLGPSFLRQVLLDQHFQFDFLPLVSRQSKHQVQEEIYEDLSYIVERECRREKLIFIAGGDHSLSIGSVQGLLRCEPNLKVLWIDAHGDVNTQASSATQSFHGMPLSFLLGLDSRFESTTWFEQKLKPENLIYFGLRDLDAAEKEFLDRLQIKNYSAEQIRGLGFAAILQEIAQELDGQPLHISLDADAFDPLLAPSTGVPVAEGLHFHDVEKLVDAVLKVADVKSFEYVELNPQIFMQPQDVFTTAQMGIDIFKMVLEKRKQQEVFHGFNDRYSDSEESDLHDPYWKLEESSAAAN